MEYCITTNSTVCYIVKTAIYVINNNFCSAVVLGLFSVVFEVKWFERYEAS